MKQKLAVLTLIGLLGGCSTATKSVSTNPNFTFSFVTPEQTEVILSMNAESSTVSSSAMLTTPDGKQHHFESPTYTVMPYSYDEINSVNEVIEKNSDKILPLNMKKVNYQLMGAGELGEFTFTISNDTCSDGMTIALENSQYELCGFDISIRQIM